MARQKRDAHLALIRKWTTGRRDRIVLKTDLFEEAFGDDHILPSLFPKSVSAWGMDSACSTVRTAANRHPCLAGRVVVMDVRQPAWAPATFDLIISTSTIDHFAGREPFLESIHALTSLLRPGGLLLLTLDNPLNPTYHLLRWYSHRKSAPFPLGYAPALSTLRGDLHACGLEVLGHEWLLHNPRGFSTLLFMAISRILGHRSDPVIRLLLRAFSMLGFLPSRPLTACFAAIAAVKPR